MDKFTLANVVTLFQIVNLVIEIPRYTINHASERH